MVEVAKAAVALAVRLNQVVLDPALPHCLAGGVLLLSAPDQDAGLVALTVFEDGIQARPRRVTGR